jgi:hypothetical protein
MLLLLRFRIFDFIYLKCVIGDCTDLAAVISRGGYGCRDMASICDVLSKLLN